MLEEYDKKKVALVAGVIFLLLVVIFVLSGSKSNPDEPVPVIATKYAVQLPDKRFQVPVETVTDNKGYTDNTGDIQYMKGIQWTSFALSGIYKGEIFSKAFYIRKENGEYEVPMSIGFDMDPTNGVIEGYIVENFENNTPYAYIYLDEDWRKKVGDTNIIWGKDLQFIQAFEWTAVGNGVYMNKIEDDIERFDAIDINSRESGIYVGDFTLEDTKTGVNDDWTAIKLA